MKRDHETMDEYGYRRSDRHRAKKTRRARPPVVEPGRVASRGSGGASGGTPRPQYVAGKAHGRRPARGQRRTGGRARALAILVVVMLAAAGIAVFVLTRPASALITVTPADAMILFDGSVVGTGTLEVEDLEPGTYTVVCERAGFEPVTVVAELKRGRTTKLGYTLAALPQTVSVITHPEGAACTMTRADGQVLSGTTPFEQQVAAGPVTLAITMSGFNTFARELFLDSPLALEYYLDPEGQILHGLGTITTLGAPKGVSVTHDGSEAWTSILNGPPSIQIFSPRTGELLGGVDIGEHGAVEVIFNKAGTLAYTSQMETAKCFEIDVATRKVVCEFDTRSAWTKWVELSPDEGTLYASNWSGDDVSIIDLATGELASRVRVSNTPRGMYATDDGKSLYVAGFDSGHLERIDLATGAVTALFTGGGALRHIVADEATGRLFISDMADDLIWVHDMVAGTTTKFVDTDEKPNTIDLTPDGKMLFVSCRGENNPKSYYIPGPEWGSILVFDTASGRPLDALIAGNQPTALDVSDDGTLLIFSDFLDNRLRVYEIPPYEEFAAGGGGRFEAHKAEIRK
ncbi:MAG: PEGA domain-containing protein [Coriobacteriia bacterium]|nr:PEGA domain-containing protein [Coriobacteriia bacterium]